MPCYRDGPRIVGLHAAIGTALESAGLTWELILVDDGSGDDTYAAIQTVAARDPTHTVGLKLARNHGQHLALCAGMSLARGRWVATCDSDLEIPPSELPRFLVAAEAGQAEVVAGVRTGRELSATRSWGSRLFNAACRSMLDKNLRDVGCMFRLYSRRAVDTLLASGSKKSYLPAATAWCGLSVRELEVADNPARVPRPSHYGLGRLVRLFADVFFEYTDLPLKLAVLIGVAMVSLGFAAFVALLGYRLFVGPGISGLSLLMALLFLLMGVQFILLGIITFYLFRVFSRPPTPGFWIHETTRDLRRER